MGITRLVFGLGLMAGLAGGQVAKSPFSSCPLPRLVPEVAGEFRPIPLEVNPVSKRAYITAAVNGVEGKFFLDTGLSDTILDTGFAARAGITNVEVRLPIIGGNFGKLGSTIEFVRVGDLEIAGTHFRNFHAVRKSLQGPRSDFTGTLAGSIGANVLLARPVTFDYRRQVISFATNQAGSHDFTFDIVPDTRQVEPRKVQGIGSRTAAVIADIDGVNVRLMFDSGAAIGDSILVNEPYQAAFRKMAGNPKAGEYRAKEVRVAGKLLLTHQRCRLRPFAETVIGSVFFDRHVITVDMSAGKVWLDRNSQVETNQETTAKAAISKHVIK